MSVKLNIHPDLLPDKRDGWATVEVKGNTVGQCLDDLVRQLPYLDKVIFDKGKLRHSLFIFANGRDTLPDQLARPVKDGDKLDLVPLVMIGSGG